MSLLNRNDLVEALHQIGKLADADGINVRLLIVGGGVMVLEYNARESTRDLDGVVLEDTDDVDIADAERLMKEMPIGARKLGHLSSHFYNLGGNSKHNTHSTICGKIVSLN